MGLYSKYKDYISKLTYQVILDELENLKYTGESRLIHYYFDLNGDRFHPDMYDNENISFHRIFINADLLYFHRIEISLDDSGQIINSYIKKYPWSKKIEYNL